MPRHLRLRRCASGLVLACSAGSVGACGDDAGDLPDPTEEQGHELDLLAARTDLVVEATPTANGVHLAITNNGPSNVTPVLVELTSQPGTVLRAADCTPPDGDVLVCVALPNLSPRSSADVTIPVEFDGSPTHRTISALVFVAVEEDRVDDLDPANNMATVTIESDIAG